MVLSIVLVGITKCINKFLKKFVSPLFNYYSNTGFCLNSVFALYYPNIFFYYISFWSAWVIQCPLQWGHVSLWETYFICCGNEIL